MESLDTVEVTTDSNHPEDRINNLGLFYLIMPPQNSFFYMSQLKWLSLYMSKN